MLSRLDLGVKQLSDRVRFLTFEATLTSASLSRRELFTTLGAVAVSPYLRSGGRASEVVRGAADKTMSGAFIILSTPYTTTNEVHHEDLAHQIDFLDRCGVHGFFWPQNSSEQRYLSKDERLKGFDTITRAARGRGQAVVFGVQADDIEGMLEYARYAEALEPDGMIAIPPTTATSLSDFREYYEALAGVTSRPVFIQTSGAAPEVEPTVECIVELARDFPNLAYIKEEREPVHERMRGLAEHRPDPIKSIFGAAFGRSWLYEMRMGMDGVMTGGAMYGDVYAQLWELHTAGKTTELRDLHGKLLLMLNLDSIIPGVRLYVLKQRGIFSTTKSRRGDYSFSPTDVAEIEYRLDALREHLRA